MSISAGIELEESVLTWNQTTLCRTTLVNDGEERLVRVNPQNRNGSATVRVTSVKTGSTTTHAKMYLPEVERPPVQLAPGQQLQEMFALSALFQFPECGIYELRAHYEWMHDEIESEPVRIEVFPTDPQSLSTATTTGSSVGDLFCAWVNRKADKHTLWLAGLRTSWETSFSWSEPVCEFPKTGVPFVSIPANRMSECQFIGWLFNNKFTYAMNRYGEYSFNSFELDSDDYQIIPPLLENPVIEVSTATSDVLLIRTTSQGWQLRVGTIGETQTLNADSKIFRGRGPRWTKTAYRSNLTRYTFILLETDSPQGTPNTTLATLVWSHEAPPIDPYFLSNFPGEAVAADMILTQDDRICGVLLTKKATDQTEYLVQKWHLDKSDVFTSSSFVVADLNENWELEHSIIRVNCQGDAFMLIKGGPQGGWYWMDPTGNLNFLSDLSSCINLPVDIVFVDQVHPALLYTDRKCGLKTAYLGPKRIYRPPT